VKAAFLHYDGYTLKDGGMGPYLGKLKKPLYRFSLTDVNPITFRRDNGELIRCDRHFTTDFGSIPRLCQLIVPAAQYRAPFIFHDSAFLHHGEYVKKPDDLCFSFRGLTMRQANERLYEMMIAEGAWWITAQAVLRVLNIAGGFAWGNKGSRDRAGSQPNWGDAR
jgi:hypothetical protein